MEDQEIKRLKDFIVVDMDVYVLRKGNKGIHARCLRHTQDRDPNSCIIRYPERMENHIKEREHYTLSLSVSLGTCIKTNTPMVSYGIREIKPFVLRPYICSKCKTPHTPDND